ncbi:helix-turn-helix domain-containing protein [Mobiluncus porci]|uniref:Helix-turn-helix transcriptional regulator n=1 Tax=Mobiluncus porci TaxID=2652278 RepID=A0A7K0K1Y5_9ACTO|nr:helix-turn-helix transcriptional regulator [Mobiluncus porci]
MSTTLLPMRAGSKTAPEIVSANIRALSARVGWNVSDLAQAVGINRPSVSERWHNRTDWRVNEIERVAALFGTTPWDLMKPAFGDEWVPDTKKLPRLDSNQQPAD